MTSSGITCSSSLCCEQEQEEFSRDLLSQELGGAVTLSTAGWASSLYVDLASESAIARYFTRSLEYEKGRWASLLKAQKCKSQLRESLCVIINSIIRHFSSDEPQVARKAVDARDTYFYRGFTGSPTLSVCHDIAIQATGPSFSSPQLASLGFSNAAACVDVGLKDLPSCETALLTNMAVYAKHTFMKQPNRDFVRSITVTGHKVRLFHFDRSGAQYSPPFDIHDDPHTFIRLILGLSSLDERIIGLDDTIKWIVGPDGEKLAGTLETVGPDGTAVMYDLAVDQGPITRTSLCGRGTTCWPARAPNGDRVVVKDYWVTEDQPPEVQLLGEAKGLPGVCQMIAYELNRAQIKDFRDGTMASDNNAITNRTKVRIVMKAYGRSIENFSSVTQFLSAPRDAIAGHKLLLDRNIIHRDISPNNILLGLEDADEGERGILIDLDLALKALGPSSDIPVDFRTGTRSCQSLMVLKSWNIIAGFTPNYDCLDDLEGFFWVFAYIILAYTPDGQRMPDSDEPGQIWSWNDKIPRHAFPKKWLLLDIQSAADDAIDAMHPGWKPTCSDLFLQFRELVHEIAYGKQSLVHKGKQELGRPAPDRFLPLLDKVDEYYARLLKMFDTALERVAETAVVAERPSPVPSPSAPNAPSESVESESTPRRCSAPSLPSTASTQGSISLSAKTGSPPEPTVTPLRTFKRRYDEAELDDCPVESKRRRPARQRVLGEIVASVYEFCRGWF